MTAVHMQASEYENAMVFSAKRLDVQSVGLIQEQYFGELTPKALETAIKAGNYALALKLLWAEGNPEKRLEILRDEKYKFHPVLPYERALAEFEASPTVETLAKVSLPLITIGHIRNVMDAKCSHDPSIQGNHDMMKATYDIALRTLIGKKCLSFSKFSKEQKEDAIKSTVSLLEELEEELSKEGGAVPTPTWLEHYGSNNFGGAWEVSPKGMKPEKNWNSMRLWEVRAQLRKIS